jgi:hypothetical protein
MPEILSESPAKENSFEILRISRDIQNILAGQKKIRSKKQSSSNFFMKNNFCPGKNTTKIVLPIQFYPAMLIKKLNTQTFSNITNSKQISYNMLIIRNKSVRKRLQTTIKRKQTFNYRLR